jgi:DNA-binding NarL/FixJ family response regulator
MAITRVLIGDAQHLFADALAEALACRSDLSVLDTRPCQGVEALRVATNSTADVALLDYWLPDMEGPVAIRELLRRAPEVKVLTLSWFHGADQVQLALRAGAVGFLPKSLSVQRVAEAVRRAHEGENPVFGEELARLVDQLAMRAAAVQEVTGRFAELTVREIEVLQLLALGRSRTAIARCLEISEATVRTHITRLLGKSGATSQLEVVTMARDAGIVP